MPSCLGLTTDIGNSCAGDDRVCVFLAVLQPSIIAGSAGTKLVGVTAEHVGMHLCTAVQHSSAVDCVQQLSLCSHKQRRNTSCAATWVESSPRITESVLHITTLRPRWPRQRHGDSIGTLRALGSTLWPPQRHFSWKWSASRFFWRLWMGQRWQPLRLP
jgi:hypothetical protein